MAGFGQRERMGLIALGIVIVVTLGLGPAARHLGCTRSRQLPLPESALSVGDTVGLDEAADTLRDAAHRGDSAAPRRTSPAPASRQRRDSVRKSRKSRSSQAPRSPRSCPAPPARSYLDEPVPAPQQ